VGSSRRLSQRIAEGDGIAIIVRVSDAEGARAAQEQGAKALAVEHAIAGLRDSSSLPVLWLAPAAPVDADAVAIRPSDDDAEGLETVIEVRDEEELEEVFESRDPEIVLISPRDGDDDPLELALELLPDVPAGKLAIADVDVGDRGEVLKLERAGFDAVLVAPGHVGSLVGHTPPDV
jgi:indole-3-glycerol phosphate synthase